MMGHQSTKILFVKIETSEIKAKLKKKHWNTITQINTNGKNHSLKEKIYNVNVSNLDPKPKVLLAKAESI